MADLIQEGKITHWGISEANEDYLRRAHAVCPVTAVQNRYSMMARHYEPLFPILEELDVGLVAFSPMANGFLTGQYGKIVPIPGTRKEDRMKENAGAASVFLTPNEVRVLDDALDHMDMSAVFGGTPLK